MNKLAAAVFAGILLVASPLCAGDPAPLDKVPEPILMQGMTDITVCIRGNRVAAKKLKEIITALQALPDDGENKKALENALDAAKILVKINDTEINIGSVIVNTLIKHYDHTMEDLSDKLKDTVEAANQTMEDTLKDVTDIEGFVTAVQPGITTCGTMVDKLVEKIEYYRNSIEVQK
jgi:hypothetical protein